METPHDLYDGLLRIADARPERRPTLERFLAGAQSDPALELGAKSKYGHSLNGYVELAELICTRGLPDQWLEAFLLSSA